MIKIEGCNSGCSLFVMGVQRTQTVGSIRTLSDVMKSRGWSGAKTYIHSDVLSLKPHMRDRISFSVMLLVLSSITALYANFDSRGKTSTIVPPKSQTPSL